MRTLVTVGMALSLMAVLGLSASAGAPAGGLFVESEEGASSKVTVSGEMRFRWENRNNFDDFSSAAHDHQEWVDARVRLGLLFELAESTEVFLQTQSRYLWGGFAGLNDAADGAAGVDDQDEMRVYQAFVRLRPELFGYKTVLTVGRAELALGSEMLLGNDSKYAGLSLDQVRLDVNPIDNLTSSLFVAKLVENSAEFDTNASALTENAGDMNDAHLIGLWNTYQLGEDALVDFYFLYVDEDDETGAGTFSLIGMDATIWTVGSRVKFDSLEYFGQKFDASFEFAVQAGEINMGADDLDIQDTFAFEGELGWSPELPWTPRFAMGLAWASGDDDNTDGNSNHFFSLTQDVQGRLGKADLFVLENLRCFYATATFKPMDIEKLSAGVTYLKFNAFEEGDALGIGGQPLGPSNVNDVGDEIDVFGSYKINDNADFKLCWSWVEPDDQVHDTAGLGNSPAHRIQATLAVKF